MTAKNIDKRVRFDNLDSLPAAPPLSQKFREMEELEAERRAAADPDAGPVPAGFWDKAQIVEPEGTEQITLRLPRRVLRHFKATGKGYHSRINAVLTSYVEAMGKKTG